MNRAWSQTGRKPSECDYVEVHATGNTNSARLTSFFTYYLQAQLLETLLKRTGLVMNLKGMANSS
jgi:hypothetical protein